MIDVWLIFNLLVPFFTVLLHTYMDSLRTEANDEGEERSINHHGKTVKVAGTESDLKTTEVQNKAAALIQRNEILEFQVSLF